jgi:tetratricopeptide (TPR) repeat protein
MTVSDDRLGLADPVRIPASRAGLRPRGPVAPPAGADDLPRFLRVTAARADADDLATAEANCDLAIEAAVRWNSAPGLAAAHSLRTSVIRRRGDLAGAERDGRTAAGLLAAAGVEPHADAALLLLARRIATRLDRGDVPGAEELLSSVDDLPEGRGTLALRYARGRLYAATGRPGEGLADLFHCGERLAARQADRPSVLPWRSSAAAVLAAIGTAEAATRLVAAEVELARTSGPASALGRALRVEGTVPGGRGLAALLEAVQVLEQTPRRFEYALALVDLGVALTAARRRPQARRVLREGLEVAEECGSPALADRARTAYAAAGGKVRSSVPEQRQSGPGE